VSDRHDVGAAAQDLGVDRPLVVPLAVSLEHVAVEIDQLEIGARGHFVHADARALDPQAAAGRIAQRQVARRAVALAFVGEDAVGESELVEARVEIGDVHTGVVSCPAAGALRRPRIRARAV
jgi:hypothetical protein